MNRMVELNRRTGRAMASAASRHEAASGQTVYECSKAKYSQAIGGLWVLFGAVWLGICTHGLLTSPFRPEHSGTQSYLIVLAFAVVAVVSGVAQVFAKILGFFGTAFLAMLLLPYIAFYFLFVGYRSGLPGIAYCVAVAIFSMATIRCFALRLKDQKPEDSVR